MKYLIVFAACFAAAFAQTPSQKLEKKIESLRDQMPCGFPDMDIGPLSPFDGEYFNLFHKLWILKINGSISDFTVFDLDKFRIDYVNLNVLTLKVNAELTFNSLRAKGDAYIESFIIGLLKLKGRGTFDIDIRDLIIKIYARIGMVDGTLRMMDLDVGVTLTDMKSKLKGFTITSLGSLVTSSIFDKTVKNFINDNAEDITENIREIVMPKANEYLKDFTVSEILKLLQEPSTETEPCIPPTA